MSVSAQSVNRIASSVILPAPVLPKRVLITWEHPTPEAVTIVVRTSTQLTAPEQWPVLARLKGVTEGVFEVTNAAQYFRVEAVKP